MKYMPLILDASVVSIHGAIQASPCMVSNAVYLCMRMIPDVETAFLGATGPQSLRFCLEKLLSSCKPRKRRRRTAPVPLSIQSS